MAVFAGIDLKKLRNEKKISAADLAERINVDATTIYRYESGKLKPDPDTMYLILAELGDPDIWTIWMRTEYPLSYGRMHPEPVRYNLQGALMSMYAEIKDVLELEKEALRDGADGEIGDKELESVLRKETTEVVASIQRVLGLLSRKDN